MLEVLDTLLAEFPILGFMVSHIPGDEKVREIRGNAINVKLKERALRMHSSLLSKNRTRFHASNIHPGLLPMPS